MTSPSSSDGSRSGAISWNLRLSQSCLARRRQQRSHRTHRLRRRLDFWSPPQQLRAWRAGLSETDRFPETPPFCVSLKSPRFSVKGRFVKILDLCNSATVRSGSKRASRGSPVVGCRDRPFRVGNGYSAGAQAATCAQHSLGEQGTGGIFSRLCHADCVGAAKRAMTGGPGMKLCGIHRVSRIAIQQKGGKPCYARRL
jgi:hypothetical protein